MNTYLPYIVSVVVAIISGVFSYMQASRKCRTEIDSLKESNRHEIERLMQQHKLDIESLERKHELEIEKMELEHKHQLELSQKQAENDLGTNLLNSMVQTAMKTPEARKAMGQAFHNKRK